ncbi:FtsK/SpoIIIE domain-containing protein [Microbacterium enclense]|uniref:FtsK/SpoIIIE domain-containing protein n=1 Tax=Microbacterium enclense TaxID=993073 RepID=UPI003F8053D3
MRTLVLAGILGAGASYAVFAALRITELTWLIVPAWLGATGIGVLVVAAVVHAGFRAGVIAKHKRMVQVRAAWAPRWAGLKEDVRLVEHEDLPGGGTVDVFDAPATLGAMGAFALTAKLVPLLGSGVTFGILPQANQDAEGQPIPGSIHPVRFRVVTFPLGSEPQVTDPEANPQELGLLAEVWAANGVRAGGNGQQAEVPQLRELTKATTPESVALVWQAHFHNPVFLGDAADGIQAGSGAPGAIPLDDSILFGELEDAARCTFVDKNLSEVLAKMVWDRDWRKRWRDVFKSKEGKMVATPQYAAKSQAILALPGGDVTLRYAPMMTRQGDKIADYMRPDIARQVATTLRGAPFCTVTWYPSRFARGERDEVAFAVIHADKEVPKDPSRIPVGASRQAALWALTRGVNDAFDAAKLPRPFVVNVHPMTAPRSAGAIWRVNLRLYDGVTLDLVKRAAVKMKGAIGSPAWLIVTGGESGATMFVGAHPAAAGVKFTTRDAENQCQVADLENAFTEAGLDSPFDGSTPQRLEVDQLPSNDQVTRMVFSVPTRRAVSDFRESKALEKVKAATGYQFFDVRTMPDPAQFEVLASRIDPMPSPAAFHWDTVTEEGYRMVPFGSRVEGNPCVWDLGLDSHVLVLGSNGSGKGIAMTAMLAPMLIHGWNVYCADPIKGFNDFGFADPWLYSRCTTYEQTAAMTKHIIGILEERKQLNAEHGVSNVRDLPDELRPPMVGVFIDEFTSLVIPDPVKKPAEGADQMTLETYAKTLQVNTAKEVIATAVGRVVREGRATGVAMVVAGQKLTSDIMSRIPGGSTIKSQFSRLAMGKMSFGDMASAFNDAQSAMGLLGPAVPRGRGIFESTSEAAFAVQTWWGGGSQAEHFAQIVEHVSSARPPLRDDERQDFTFADKQAQTAAPVFGRVKGETSSTPPPPSVAVPLPIDDDEIVAVIDGDGLGLDFGSEEDDTIEEVVIVEGEGLGLTFDDEPAPLITSTPALIPPLRVLAEPVEANPSPPDPMDLFPGMPTPIRIDSDVRFD